MLDEKKKKQPKIIKDKAGKTIGISIDAMK